MRARRDLQGMWQAVMVNPADLLRWGAWRQLATASRNPEIPATPGLYRIRRIGRDDLDYIGQTGMGTMTLRKRLGMLRGVFGEVMPYRDPHTAGPALWALYHRTCEDFEVSVVPVEGSTPSRKGLEALAIALYRQEQEVAGLCLARHPRNIWNGAKNGGRAKKLSGLISFLTQVLTQIRIAFRAFKQLLRPRGEWR